MILNRLVENYFERNGSFNGIESTYIGEELASLGKKFHLSVLDVCFAILGFSPVQLTGTSKVLKPSEVFDLSAKCLAGNTKGLSKYRISADADLSVYAHDLGLRKKDIGTVMVKGLDNLSPELKQIKNLLYAFYSNSQLFAIETKDVNGNPICVGLQDFCSMYKKVEPRKLMQQLHLLPVVHSPEVKKPIISGMTLYTNKDLSKNDIETLQEMAITEIVSSSFRYIREIGINTLPFLAYTDTAAYKRLLLVAKASHQTYQEFVYSVGIQIPDLLQCFEQNRMLIYTFFDKVYFLYYDFVTGENTGVKGPISRDIFLNSLNTFTRQFMIDYDETPLKHCLAKLNGSSEVVKCAAF